MPNCRACLRRCIQALDTTASSTYRFRHDAVSPLLFGQQRRSLRTSDRTVRKVGARPTHVIDIERTDRAKEEPWRKSTQARSINQRERQGLKRQPVAVTARNLREVGMETPEKLRKLGRRDPSMPAKDFNNRRRELRHLTDPLELANFVKKELNKDKVEEMLQLVRMASHSMQCIVGWNHIIDYYLARGRVAHALKVYNDMKKRAQFPDSYTYTILLRGLAANAHDSGALGKALSIYHSMSAPNSRVQPSIIHTNAMLKVCARALDMDGLWGVAAKIPESGPASANATTYVTILNAIRQSLLVNVPVGEEENQTAERRERGIMEGRRMWEEIVGKWRNADLIIDEELACTMGRLLLIGARPRDWDDVLSLVEQTMDIPRLVPRLGTPARKEAGYPNLRAPNVPEQFRFDDDHLSPGNRPARGDEFLPITAYGVKSAVSNPLTYATPTNNTLSLVQEACQKVVAMKAADEYWNLLTDPTTYGIVPDVNNLNARLRVLRQNRASAQAVDLLTHDFLGKGMEPRAGTIRIAMSTCVRDKNNHNSLRHAGQIVDIMMKTLEDADPKTVSRYAELAVDFPLAKGSDYIDALARLHPIVNNIRLQLGVGGADRGTGKGACYLYGEQRRDAITALRKILGLYDKLVNSVLVSEEEKRPYKVEKARLSAFLHRVDAKDGKRSKRLESEHGYTEEKVKDGDGEGEEGEERGSVGSGRERRTRPTEERKAWSSPSANHAM